MRGNERKWTFSETSWISGLVIAFLWHLGSSARGACTLALVWLLRWALGCCSSSYGRRRCRSVQRRSEGRRTMFFQVFPELGVKHCVYQLVLFWLFEGPGLELATGRRRPAGYGRVVNFPAGSFRTSEIPPFRSSKGPKIPKELGAYGSVSTCFPRSWFHGLRSRKPPPCRGNVSGARWTAFR